MSRTLYICYFGVREPLVQTQVLPYLREIIKGGVEVSLLTFEPRRTAEDIREFSRIRQKLAEDGIKWDWLAYHKRPSAVATAWDILRGAIYIWRRIGRFDVLHGRVHVPTLMAAIARKFSLKKPKILFDIRGFMPEEYTDAGIWPEGGWLYRTAKAIEKWLMHEADAFVVLTEKAREILFPESRETGRDQKGRPVEVIPCCVDLEKRFSGNRQEMRQEYRKKLGVDGRTVFVHIGALGGLYLTKEMAKMLATFRKKMPDIFALFLTQSDPMIIEQELIKNDFNSNDFYIGRVSPDEIANYLFAADYAISFVKASYATLSRSPTKIPEYLACGLPIIANKGVGDVDLLIEKYGVGVIVEQFEEKAYLNALDAIERLGEVSAKCREVAKEEFDLISVGGVRYRRIYGV